MARAKLALASQTVAAGNQITAKQANAGLPSGRYSITYTEAQLLPGLPANSGFIDSYYGHAGFQVQEFRPFVANSTATYRRTCISTWTDFQRTT